LDAGGEVVRLAGAARASGAHGIVCAGPEVPAVRRAHGDALRVLVPGVRLAGAASHDQSRVTTPRDAADGGASYLVLGRVVTAAPDPPSALEHVRASLS
ncbi:MAG: orotidine 5'-phosphate decarboxylase / HUMPS family protein, partial [Gemmatimonadaceae bacterium]